MHFPHLYATLVHSVVGLFGSRIVSDYTESFLDCSCFHIQGLQKWPSIPIHRVLVYGIVSFYFGAQVLFLSTCNADSAGIVSASVTSPLCSVIFYLHCAGRGFL